MVKRSGLGRGKGGRAGGPLCHNSVMNDPEIGDKILSAPLSEPNEGGLGSRWRPEGGAWPKDLGELKKFMGWIFLAQSLLSLKNANKIILYTIRPPDPLPALRGLLSEASFIFVFAVSCGVASWTIWKGKPSARGWAITASLLSILLFVFGHFVFRLRFAWAHQVDLLLIGVVGLVAFLPRGEHIGA